MPETDPSHPRPDEHPYGLRGLLGDVSGGVIAALIALPYGLAMAKLMGTVDLYVGTGQDLSITNLTGHPTVVLPDGFRDRDGTLPHPGADQAAEALGDVGGGEQAIGHQRPRSISKLRSRVNGRSGSRCRADAAARRS